MATYPQLDLPPLTDELEMRLQSERFLDMSHINSEDNNYFFSVSHTAIRLATEAGFETPQFKDAVDTGVRIFEVLGYLVEPDEHYDSDIAKALTFASTMQFVESLKSSDDFLTICDYARSRMEQDAPRLTQIITETAERYTNYDKVATAFALRGAAAVRGMQIFVDRRLEAAV